MFKFQQRRTPPINEWANYIKHKGGVKFLGLEADEPVEINIKDKDGNTIADNNFATIELDLDESMQTLSTVHRAYLICLEQLEGFINYGAAVPKANAAGKMLIPNKTDYVRII